MWWELEERRRVNFADEDLCLPHPLARRQMKEKRTFDGHSSFESADFESSSLKSEGDDVQEGNELREDERLRRHVLGSKLGEFLDESFDFGGGSEVLEE